MKKFKRIDPQAVPEICRKRKIVPVRGVYVGASGRRCAACAVGIHLIDAVGKKAALAIMRAWQELELAGGYDPNYIEGLSNGWEGCVLNYCWRLNIAHSPDRFRAGHRDGKAAWKACVNAGLVSP